MHAVSWLAIGSVVVLAVGLAIALVAETRRSWDVQHYALGLAITGGVASIFFGIGAGIAYVDNMSCETIAAESNVEYRYGLIAGCRLQLEDGRYVPEENWRVTEERDD
jgi:hypothetical protein